MCPEYQPVGLCVSTPYLEERHELKILPVEQVPENFHQVCLIYKPNGFHPHSANLFAEFVEKNFSLEDWKEDTA